MVPFFIVLLVVAIIVVIRCIQIVPQAHSYIVERLGAYQSTLDVGMHLLVPVIDKVARKISLKEQVLDFPPQTVITKDNVSMKVDTIIYYNVTDPKLFTYAVEKPLVALENITATTLRNIIGSLELDETLTSRDTINDNMQKTLDEATDPWGIKVKRVEIKDIQPPKGILDTMEKQMRAERDRRETLLEAEGHKQAVVMRAEGDKKAKVLAAEAERDAKIALAEGESKSIELVYKAQADGLQMLKDVGVDEATVTLKKIEALKDIANGKATKLVIPTEIASIASTMSVITETLNTKVNEEVEETPKKIVADPCCDDKDNTDGFNNIKASRGNNKDKNVSNGFGGYREEF